MLKSINPYTWELNWEFETISAEQVDLVIDNAYEAYKSWKNIPASEKKELFLKLADELDRQNEECARLETIEMWMLNHISKAWLKKTADLIRWNANNFENILWEKQIEAEWINWTEMYDPIWVIFWVAPWNFPFNQLLRAAVPNLLAWNTQIYKHSSNVPLCALKIQELFDNVWFPKGVYQNVFVSSSLSEHIISNPKIAWVNLTGSERAWSAVWSLAWKYLKPSVLELGWNDAFLVIDNDNLDEAASLAVSWRIRNWWQWCNNSKRFIVLDKYYDEFCSIFAQKMSELKLWNPMDEQTELPPLVSQKAVEEALSQINRAVESWAEILTWWKRSSISWAFLEPTAMKIDKNVISYNEEIFAPVASIMSAKDIDEAIELANSTDFWLSACVYWSDIDQVKDVCKKLEWWMIFINQIAWSKAQVAFWWVRKSWYGKENWPEWLKAFANKKVIIN